MARIRNLKPQFFTDEDVAELSPWARLLFMGLWTLADRSGRLEERQQFIRVQVFPYDDFEGKGVTMAGLLEELSKERRHHPGSFITRYEANGRRYLQINAFEKHQKCHPEEAKSEIPPPPLVTEKPRDLTANRDESRDFTATNLGAGESQAFNLNSNLDSNSKQTNRPSSLRSDVSEVFAYWQKVMEHPDAKLTDERRRKIEGRLREGSTVEQIKAAIDGCRASAFHMGENDAGKRHDDVTLICRSGAKLDWFRQKARPTNGAPKRTAKEDRSLDRAMRLAGLGGIDAGQQRDMGPRDVGTGATALARRGQGDGEPPRGSLPPGAPAVPDGPPVETRRE